MAGFRKLYWGVIVVCVVSVSAFAGMTVPGQLVVKFRGGFGFDDRLFIERSGLHFVDSSIDNEVHLLQFDGSTTDIAQVIALLLNSGRVEYVYPNYIFEIYTQPNDPMYDQLWGLRNTGQEVTIKDRKTGKIKVFKGVPGVDASLEEAWEISTGSKDIVVAVIDTGVDYSHEDLKQNIWHNPKETPDNGIDDDGNGRIDDIVGWDFAGDGDQSLPIPLPGGDGGDNDPMDAHFHGTHVAGTIGAVGNNGTGVVGVNWDVSIMAVKFLGKSGQGSLFAAIDAIKYAAASGAKVINASWGGPQDAQPLEDAINAAIAQGVLFVAAAGNGGEDQVGDDNDTTTSFPANYTNPGILTVAATGNDGSLTWFSNYGARSVDVAAPGLGILSTIPNREAFGNQDYGDASGTSMATPHVSGLAALILSVDPDLTVMQVKSIIMASVDKTEELAGKVVTGGRINASTALRIVSEDQLYIVPNDAVVKLNESFDFTAYGGNGVYSWEVSNPSLATIDQSGQLTALQEGEVVVTARDSAGAVAVTSAIKLLNKSGDNGGTPTPGNCPPGTVPFPFPMPGMPPICIPVGHP